MGIFGLVLIIIACLSLYTIMHITIYNKMQFYLTKIENVEGMIDEVLREKYDILLKIDKAIKDNLKDKNDYLKELKELKKAKISNFEMQRKLAESESLLENIYYDHEELKDKNNFKKYFADLKRINEKLTAGVTYYNTTTSILNNYIRKFPNNIIAKFHRIKIKVFFDGKDMTDNDIFDFKL